MIAGHSSDFLTPAKSDTTIMEIFGYTEDMALIDIAGQRFERLLVIQRAEGPALIKNRDSYWRCKCDCGQQVVVNSRALRTGHTKSCGCWHRERSADRIGLRSRHEIPWLSSRNALISRYKHKAKEDGRCFLLTDEECERLFKGNCFYCGVGPSKWTNNHLNKRGERLDRHTKKFTKPSFDVELATFLFNGIDRINNSIGYLSNNCVPCCAACNSAKSDQSLQDWLTYLHAIQNRSPVAQQITPLACLDRYKLSSLRKLFSVYKSSAKRRKLSFNLCLEEAHSLFQQDCSYCHRPASQIYNAKCRKDGSLYNSSCQNPTFLYNYSYSGIDRISSDLGYSIDQCVPCCGPCNRAKGGLPTHDFHQWLKRIENSDLLGIERGLLSVHGQVAALV